VVYGLVKVPGSSPCFFVVGFLGGWGSSLAISPLWLFSWCFSVVFSSVVVRVCGFFGCLVFSEVGGGRRRFFPVASPLLAAADLCWRR
jgi:hypothetical protein